MRCKACDTLLGEYGDLELCDECLVTIKPDFEVPEILVSTDTEDDIEDADM